jgi:hypothetical protein
LVIPRSGVGEQLDVFRFIVPDQRADLPRVARIAGTIVIVGLGTIGSGPKGVELARAAG